MISRERHLLAQPAPTVVRHLARQRVEEMQGAASRLDTDDAEALHDFRVAARRLRTLLRAYAELELVPNKAVRRLRKIASATNQARDLEVALEYLRGNAKDEPGAALVAERLGARFRHVRADTIETVKGKWPGLESRLHRALDSTDEATAPSFRAMAARLIAAEQQRLLQLLAALRTAWDDDTAHRVRIAGKRLRYLLEPLSGELPPARQAVATLKAFQDDFGRYHDLWVLLGLVAESAAEAAAMEAHARASGHGAPSISLEPCLALAARVRADRHALAESLASASLSPAPEPLRHIAATLEALAAA